MDTIVTLKGKENLELSRRVMNEAMDVIYQVGHNRVTMEFAQERMHHLLKEYFFDGTEFLEAASLSRFKQHFNSLKHMATELLCQIDIKKDPLYKTIVKMNQLLAGTQKLKENFLQRHERIQKPKRVKVMDGKQKGALLTFKQKNHNGKEGPVLEQKSKPVEEKEIKENAPCTIQEQMKSVLEHREKFKNSILALNKALEGIGLEIREIDPSN